MGVQKFNASLAKRNATTVVSVSAFVWMLFLDTTIPGFNLVHAIMVGVYVSSGARPLSNRFNDFHRGISTRVFLLLIVIAPAWPILTRTKPRTSRD